MKAVSGGGGVWRGGVCYGMLRSAACSTVSMNTNKLLLRVLLVRLRIHPPLQSPAPPRPPSKHLLLSPSLPVTSCHRLGNAEH